jgi:hypothetical protein
MDEMDAELLFDKTRFLPFRVMKVNSSLLAREVGLLSPAIGVSFDLPVSACQAT